MVNQLSKRPLPSREERLQNASANGALDGSGHVDIPDADGLEALKARATAAGYVLRKETGVRRVRPWRDGTDVRFTCRLSAPVREALEFAKGELDLHGSQIVEVALVEFLVSRGLRVPGYPLGPQPLSAQVDELGLSDDGTHQPPAAGSGQG